MAVSVQREAYDVSGIVVPACVDRVAHDVSYLWEDVLDEGFIAAERYPLSQLGGHTHYHTLTHA